MCKGEVSCDGTSIQGPYADSLLSPCVTVACFAQFAIPRTSAQRETEYFDGSIVVRRYQHNCERCRIFSTVAPRTRARCMWYAFSISATFKCASWSTRAVARSLRLIGSFFYGPTASSARCRHPTGHRLPTPPPAPATFGPPLHEEPPDRAPPDVGGTSITPKDGD